MVPSWFRHWFELRQVKQRRPLFIKLDRIALAIVGTVAALAVLWGAANSGLEPAKGAPIKVAAPSCYAIGTSIASGCTERAK